MKRLACVSPVKVVKLYHLKNKWHLSYKKISEELKISEKNARKIVENGGIEVIDEMHRLQAKSKKSYNAIASRFGLTTEKVKEAVSMYREKIL